MNAASSVLELLADPLAAASRSLDDLAETLLRRFAEPRAEWSVTLADLPDPHARSLFRSLLACLARKSAQESGTALDPYGGTLVFVRDTAGGPVRVEGTFDNRSGTARLTLQPPVPCPDGQSRTSGRGGDSVVDAFAPAVVDYWIDDIAFSLASDLARLDRVRAAGAAESAVLYCNRIVEAMARRTVGSAARSATPSLAGLINDLAKYHHLPPPLKRLLHALRELGNDARHAVQPVTAAEVDVAFAVLLRWLQWAFCESAAGPRLPALNRPNSRTDALLPRGLARLVEAAAAGEKVLSQLTDEHAGGLVTPMLLAAAAEGLISGDGLPAAREVLDVGRTRFPHDRRLCQLDGLYWSRLGGKEKNVEYLHTARAVLEPLLPQNGGLATDEETFGILGGLHKRLSDLDAVSSRDWLWQSHRTYRAGWEQSRRSNDYLGINAATTALWLGLDTVAEVSGPICDGLAALSARLRADGRTLDFWDQVIWAEALLLRGDLGPAGEQYRGAFERFAVRTSDIGVAAKQARRILERRDESERAADVLGRWSDAGA